MIKNWLKALFFLIAIAITISIVWANSEPEQTLTINEETVSQLMDLRAQDKFTDLPGYDIDEEKNRLANHLNFLLDKLNQGIKENPRKSWVIDTMRPTIKEIYLEDTEARDRFTDYVDKILEILNVKVNGNEFSEYLIFLKKTNS